MSENTKEAVDALRNGETSEFQSKITDELREKALGLIHARKIELASGWLNEQENGDDENDDDDDDEDEKNRKKKKKNGDDDEDEDDDSQEEGNKKRKKY